MEYMEGLEDNAFDLAIVDPPYGIGIDGGRWNDGNSSEDRRFRKDNPRETRVTDIVKGWDGSRPGSNYFTLLRRVSTSQIIWGGNYFADLLPASRCWLCWDKKQPEGVNFSDFEVAYTSFDSVCKTFRMYPTHVTQGQKIHPTQKPINLYKWLLSNYAEPGQRILDTHLGSGSSAIAAHYGGFDFVGCEIDEDYYKAAVERFNNETRQQAMF